MKGLLVKDFKLFSKQKRIFATVVAIYAFLIITKSEPIFLVSYLNMMFLFFTISTISYDEFDNGMLFLFSLPIDRRLYVREKYIFGLITGGVSWSLSVICIFIWQIISKSNKNLLELLIACVVVLPILYIFWSLLLPLQLKFGSEKSRIVLIGAVGFVLLLGYLCKLVVNGLHINVKSSLETLLAQNSIFLAIGVIIITIITVYISYLISIGIMHKKNL